MSRTLKSILATAGLAVALAAPAQAELPTPADPVARVPAGAIEHTVTVVKVEGSNAVPSHRRVETWLTRNSARSVVTDVRSGKVVAETAYRDGVVRMYNAEDNRIMVIHEKRRRGSQPPFNAAAFEAAVQKAYIDEGYVRIIGEKLVDGRRALITQSVQGGKWRSDDARSVTTAVVDAETFRLYERTTSLPGGEFSQTSTHEVVELLSTGDRAARARLAMARHAGATVKHRTLR